MCCHMLPTWCNLLPTFSRKSSLGGIAARACQVGGFLSGRDLAVCLLLCVPRITFSKKEP